MYDTIIIVVEDPNTATTAASIIPVSDILKRFFIFIGQTPTINDLKWLTINDNHLILENITNFGEEFINIAIRTGILYTRANNFIFCSTNNLPSEKEILGVLKNTIKTKKTELIIESNFLCASREYLLFYGFDDLYNKFNENIFNSSNQSTNQYELAQAINGQESSEETVISALNELIDLNKIHLKQDLKIFEISNFWNKARKTFKSLDSSNPQVIIYYFPIDKSTLEKERKNIPPNGAIIITTMDTETTKELPNPFQKLKTNTGIFLSIYTHI
jgi:hypothetical protein